MKNDSRDCTCAVRMREFATVRDDSRSLSAAKDDREAIGRICRLQVSRDNLYADKSVSRDFQLFARQTVRAMGGSGGGRKRARCRGLRASSRSFCARATTHSRLQRGPLWPIPSSMHIHVRDMHSRVGITMNARAYLTSRSSYRRAGRVTFNDKAVVIPAARLLMPHTLETAVY